MCCFLNKVFVVSPNMGGILRYQRAGMNKRRIINIKIWHICCNTIPLTSSSRLTYDPKRLDANVRLKELLMVELGDGTSVIKVSLKWSLNWLMPSPFSLHSINAPIVNDLYSFLISSTTRASFSDSWVVFKTTPNHCGINVVKRNPATIFGGHELTKETPHKKLLNSYLVCLECQCSCWTCQHENGLHEYLQKKCCQVGVNKQ
jgi:hypothetical protein